MARSTAKPAARTRKKATRAKRVPRPPPAPRVAVLVATRKGAFLYHGDAARRNWRIDGPHFLGHIISHLVLDPRDRRTLLAAANPGPLAPPFSRPPDPGRSGKEPARPPAFPKAAEGET